MALLDVLLDTFLESTGFNEVRDPNVRLATEQERRPGRLGAVDIFKQDPVTGEQVRLERPQSQPLQFGEFLGLEQPQEVQETQEPEGFNILDALGPITGFGSPFFEHGLDIDLETGDPVPSPISGIIESVGARGGFGNQVAIRDPQNRLFQLSHLDQPSVRPGQRISAGDIVGTGGATGNVIDLGGGGSHLDLSVREGDRFIDPTSVADMLRSFG